MGRSSIEAVAVLAMMVGAGEARADLSVQSFDFTVFHTQGFQDYTIREFNPTLGTLTGVQIAINSGSLNGETGVFVPNTNDSFFATSSVDATLRAIGPGFSFTDNPTASIPGFFNGGRGFVTNVHPLNSGSFSIGHADFGGYTGTGTTDFSLIYLPSAYASDSRVSASLVNQGWWTGSVTVTYTYTAATPEPSTMLPAGISCLAGLGYAWRRRKTNLGSR